MSDDGAFGSMRLLGLAVLAAASTSAAGVGGVVVGTGTGTLFSLDQSWSCADILFHVDALYLPGDKGILHLRYGLTAAALSCLLLTGEGAILGTLHYDLAGPSLENELHCVGTESQGMFCEAEGTTGATLRGEVGPHGFMGDTWVRFQGSDFLFFAEFMAI